MKETQALAKAIHAVGSQSRLADLVGVRPQAVSSWVYRLKRVPAERVLAVEKASGVPRHELRPDIYPPEDAKL